MTNDDTWLIGGDSYVDSAGNVFVISADVLFNPATNTTEVQPVVIYGASSGALAQAQLNYDLTFLGNTFNDNGSAGIDSANAFGDAIREFQSGAATLSAAIDHSLASLIVTDSLKLIGSYANSYDLGQANANATTYYSHVFNMDNPYTGTAKKISP